TVPKPAAVHIDQQPPKKPPAPTKSQVPQVDDFRTTYHPSSGRPTKYDAFENYGTRPSNPLPFDDKPWLPFHSEIEFVFAKIMLDCAISNKNVDALINVVRALLESGGPFEVKDHKDLENLWTSAAGLHGLAPFEPSEVKVLYQNRPRIHMLWSRPLMSWIVNALEDTFLASVINWDAIRTDKFDGKDWIPFITELWTARHMWKFQSHIPKDGKPIAITLYADKTRLSSFGGHQGYPIMANINNFPDTIRNGHGLGSTQVVGWLPI
ncbi:hypothetical protein DXG01_013245, partial [Tephrocybe rancida]